MRFYSYFLILFLLCLSQLWAQKLVTEKVPDAAENEFKKAFLSASIEPTSAELEEKRLKLMNDRLSTYLKTLKTGATSKNVQSLEEEKRIQEFVDCVKHSLNNDLSKSMECRENWKAMMKGDFEELRRKGLPIPDEFARQLQFEIQDLDRKMQSYNKEDEVLVMENVMAFDEVAPETMMNLQAIDPQIKTLGRQVSEIVLKISKSNDAVSAIKAQKPSTVPDELFVLGEMLEMVEGRTCENEATFVINNGPNFDLLKELAIRGDKEKKKKKETGSYILGIEPESNLAEMMSYRFEENGTTYYLFPTNRNGVNTETWVMGILPPDGKLQFRYFKLQVVQPDNTELKGKNADWTLLNSNRQETRSTLKNENKFYFQAQEGLVLKTDEVRTPIVGTTVVPKAKLVIGRVHMAYLTKKSIYQTDISIRHDDIMLSTESRPISANWSVGGQVKVSPINGKWTMNSNVRINNFLVGYGQNSSGQSSANISYILSRNFINLQTDSENTKMSLGRQLKNGKGYVMADTDFKSITEVKFVLYIP